MALTTCSSYIGHGCGSLIGMRERASGLKCCEPLRWMILSRTPPELLTNVLLDIQALCSSPAIVESLRVEVRGVLLGEGNQSFGFVKRTAAEEIDIRGWRIPMMMTLGCPCIH